MWTESDVDEHKEESPDSDDHMLDTSETKKSPGDTGGGDGGVVASALDLGGVPAPGDNGFEEFIEGLFEQVFEPPPPTAPGPPAPAPAAPEAEAAAEAG